MRRLTLLPMLLLLAAGPTSKPATQPSHSEQIAAELRPHLDQFQMRLYYLGQQEKPYYALTLSVQPMAKADPVPFHVRSQITREQAGKVLDALVASGALEHLAVHHRGAVEYAQPCYILQIGVGPQAKTYIGSLGFDRNLLKYLDAVREPLDGDAAFNMDLLLGRLSGHRAEWDKK